MREARVNEDDRRQLAERGIAIEEALRQLELFRRPPRYVELDRACIVGDGIKALGPTFESG